MNFDLRRGDCLDPASGIASLADKSVDVVITDPPYEAEAHIKQRRIQREKNGDGRVIKTESLAFEPITESQRQDVARHLARITKRWILVFCQIEASPKWRACFEDAGFIYRRTCIWVKPDGMPQYSGDRPGMGYETFIACHAPGRSRWNGGGRHGVFTFNKIGTDDVKRTGHQTQKPLLLMEELVDLFTDHGETICDPFAGSGTTGIAAIHSGRKFIGWELNERWFAVAHKRMSRTREQLTFMDALTGTR